MRSLIVIFLTFAIQSGLFARVASANASHAVPVSQTCHEDTACDDHDCTPCPDGKDCPLNGCPHHHHDGVCVHQPPLASHGGGARGPLPPVAVTMAREEFHARPPDGPVLGLDKPPQVG